MRKPEILCSDLGDVLEVLLGDMRERSLEIGEVFFGETNDPATGVGEFVACPYIRSRHSLGEDLGHRKPSFATRSSVPHCIAPVTTTRSRRGGQCVRKDTKTHQDRWLAIDPETCALIMNYLDETRVTLAAVGVELRDDAYLFSN